MAFLLRRRRALYACATVAVLTTATLTTAAGASGSSAETVTFRAPLSGTLKTLSYSAGDQNPANSNIVIGSQSAASVRDGITLPAESMTILQTQ